MQILFYEVITLDVYSNASLQHKALGGTEATILRIAHALKHYHSITIAQGGRQTADNEVRDGVNYVSLATANHLSPDVVILLRETKWLDYVGKTFPHARHFFWMHNMPSRNLYDFRDVLIKHQYEIIAVSHFHRAAINKRLHGKCYQRLFAKNKHSKIPVHTLYNPIDDHLKPDNTPRNPQQMLFLSAPYKGLQQSLKMFDRLRAQFPEYKLLIASHCQRELNIHFPENTHLVGPLIHQDVIQLMRESFCVFYPQTERVETYGLVYAEANAVGTPVLAHDFGAANEILTDASQLINGNKFSTIKNKITEWRKERLDLEGKTIFKLSHVIPSWLELLSYH